jgi:quaternary ammonium compound-resistance protein SugE
MAWVYLILAGLLEIGWAIGMKYSQGFTRPLPTLFTIATMIVSFALLAIALRTIPVGTGYAVWTGIGAVGTAILGIVLFHDSANPVRLFFLALILVGIVGLKFFGGSHEETGEAQEEAAVRAESDADTAS